MGVRCQVGRNAAGTAHSGASEVVSRGRCYATGRPVPIAVHLSTPCHTALRRLRFATAATLCLVASAALAQTPAIGTLRWIGSYEISTGTLFEGVEFGGISGLDRAPDGRYWAISDDRGGDRGPPRFYELKIELDAQALRRVSIERMVVLRGPDGQPLPAAVPTVDPAATARRLAEKRVAGSPVEVEHVGLRGESIPLDDNCCDAALSTFTLCTIPDVEAALGEVRRVLRPGGRLSIRATTRSPSSAEARFTEGTKTSPLPSSLRRNASPLRVREARPTARSMEPGSPYRFPFTR